MIDGYIRLHRKMVNWEWFCCDKTFKLFIFCLMMANWEPKKWKGKTIERGQFITSYAKLSEQTGLTIRSVRTCLDNLVLTHELTRQSTNHYTLISILNYNNYQDQTTHQTTHQTTSQRQSNDNPTTTTKNIKNYNNNINIYSNFLKLAPFDPFQSALVYPDDLKDEINRIMKQAFLTFKLSEDEKKDFIEYWFSADVNGYPFFLNPEKNFNPSRKASNWKQNAEKNQPIDEIEALKRIMD